jgi:hypothetical protein
MRLGGPSTYQNPVEKSNIVANAGNQTRVPRSSNLLSWLSYPGAEEINKAWGQVDSKV